MLDGTPLSQAKRCKQRIDVRKPFSTVQARKLEQYYKLMLECGSHSLKRDETAANQSKAADYVMNLWKNKSNSITEDILRQIHHRLYEETDSENAGLYRTIDLAPDKKMPLEAAPVGEIEHLMQHFVSQLECSKGILNPIEYAAMGHKRFMEIQPFLKGNEMVGTMMMSLLLLLDGYWPVMIPLTLVDEYRQTMQLAQASNNMQIDSYVDVIANSVLEAGWDGIRVLEAADF